MPAGLVLVPPISRAKSRTTSSKKAIHILINLTHRCGMRFCRFREKQATGAGGVVIQNSPTVFFSARETGKARFFTRSAGPGEYGVGQWSFSRLKSTNVLEPGKVYPSNSLCVRTASPSLACAIPQVNIISQSVRGKPVVPSQPLINRTYFHRFRRRTLNLGTETPNAALNHSFEKRSEKSKWPRSDGIPTKRHVLSPSSPSRTSRFIMGACFARPPDRELLSGAL